MTLDNESRTQYQMDAPKVGKMVQDAEAEARMAKQDLEEAQGKLKAALEWIGGCGCKHCPEIRRILRSKEDE